jgi:chromosome segregation protein
LNAADQIKFSLRVVKLRISKLRLNGFKSFVDPTDLIISDGLTGVVGPNGCGKSNLLEALRWVMGENRPSAIRGGEMDDVIFAGAASRPAKNFAEVALKIDNSDRSAPREFDKFDSFDVLRRITRDSGSAYKVNGKDYRARDVQMLFADASTGAHSPALVRQGQISELINSKPKSRRRILEEAAGISGLYQRRHEAELKLSGAEVNLARIDDILEQLLTQLGQLSRQAKQAIRYREIGDDIRNFEGKLLYRRWNEAEDSRLRADSSLNISLNLASETNKSAERDREIRELSEINLPALKEEESTTILSLQRLKADMEALKDKEFQATQAISNLTEALKQLKVDLSRESLLNSDAYETLEGLKTERAKLQNVSGSYEKKLAEVIEHARSSSVKLQQFEAEFSEKNEDVARLSAKHQAADRLFEDLNATLVRVVEEEKKSNSELELSRSNVEGAELNFTKSEKNFQDAKAAFEQVDKELGVIDSLRNEIQTREAQARIVSSESQGNSNALRAEVNSLARLLERDTADSEQLIDQIKVEKGYELALGAAFQDELRNPVLDNQNGSGWLKFDEYPESQSLPDNAEPLSYYVQAPGAVARRISQVGVVDKMVGMEMQLKLKPGQRIVSKEGDLWRWDGFKIEAADASSTSAIRLQQLNKLEELKQESERASSESVGSKQAHNVLLEELQKLTLADQVARVSRQEADRLMTLANRAMSNSESEKSVSLGRVENFLLSVARNNQEALTTRKRISEVRETLSSLESLEVVRFQANELKEKVDKARTDMITKRSMSEELRKEEEVRCARLIDIEQLMGVWTARLQTAEERSQQMKLRESSMEMELSKSLERPDQIAMQRDQLKSHLELAEHKAVKASANLVSAETHLRLALEDERNSERKASEAREQRARSEVVLESALIVLDQWSQRIIDEQGYKPEELLEQLGLDPSGLPSADKLEESLDKLRKQRDSLGAVNLRAEEDSKAVQEEHDTLKLEKDDLDEAIRKLRSGISSLNREGRERILTAFEQVNENFGNLFKHLFNGGEGKLVMVESEDPLDAGLEIMCQPPGKKLSTLSLLSGGEQTLTALALIFAVFLANPAPLCVLDEVDAPLDDANVTRFCDLLDEMTRQTETRFLIITHHAVTMSRMDRLFGITMGELGVSQLVSVDLKKAERLVA